MLVKDTNQRQLILDVLCRTADVRNTHYICKYCFLYAYKWKKIHPWQKSYIHTDWTKIPNSAQYPAKQDLQMTFGKGEFNLVPSKLNDLLRNWEICKVNAIYTKVANFPFINTEILLENFIFKQELNISFLQSKANIWLNTIRCLHILKW